MDESGKTLNGSDGRPVLQFVSVQRRDNHQWAIPGVSQGHTGTGIQEMSASNCWIN